MGSRATGAHSPEILMIEMAAYLRTVVKTEGGWRNRAQTVGGPK